MLQSIKDTTNNSVRCMLTNPPVVTEVLQKIGFSENEASVYLALLNLGKATTIQAAKIAKLSRTTTYDVLRSLMRKGVITEIKDKKKTLFAIESLELLQGFLEKKEMELLQGKEALKNIRIEMESIRYPFKALPKVRLFEGNLEVRAMMRDLFKNTNAKEYAFVCTDYFIRTYFDFFREFDDLRTSQGIETKLLIHDTDIKKSLPAIHTDQHIQMRTLEEGHRYDAGMHILGNTVAFWSAKNNLVVVQMESEEISSMHHQVFLDLWAQALLK